MRAVAAAAYAAHASAPSDCFPKGTFAVGISADQGIAVPEGPNPEA